MPLRRKASAFAYPILLLVYRLSFFLPSYSDMVGIECFLMVLFMIGESPIPIFWNLSNFIFVSLLITIIIRGKIPKHLIHIQFLSIISAFYWLLDDDFPELKVGYWVWLLSIVFLYFYYLLVTEISLLSGRQNNGTA